MLKRPPDVDIFVLDNISERSTKHLLVEVSNLAEINARIGKLKNGKAHGVDGLGSEICKDVAKYLCTMLINVIQRVWNSELVPTDWRDAILAIL